MTTKENREKLRLAIKITGVVQGVGFRPTVYRYALGFALTGNVNNTAQGVFIEVEGAPVLVHAFVERLRKSPPPQARIDEFSVREIPCVYDQGFSIIHSENQGAKDVEISPDLATCPDCLRDIFDQKQTRRYHYPFTNCTNCGPRFTIVRDRPYDRPLTSMASFPMCPDCQAEYDNPLDRRFHAQPNACAICGPRLNVSLAEVAEGLKAGELWGIKGLGGFNLVCSAFHRSAITRMRKVKNRPTKSLAVMMDTITTIREYCEVNEAEERELTSVRAPIVLLKKKDARLDYLSPDNNYLGVMLPYTPLHHLLLKEYHLPALIMTSANRRDEPIAITDNEMQALVSAGVADRFLTHDRAILHRADDSILQIIDQTQVQVIRRSRGFVPSPVILDNRSENTNKQTALALGANMKNTFAFKQGHRLFMSQHIGELMDQQNIKFQQEQIQDWSKLLEISSAKEIIDAHPAYENFDHEKQQVFHHHAHLLSVIAEHQLSSKKNIVGLIIDGTGFGADETIWGGEVLQIKGQDLSQFTRLGHLKTFFLPGSEKALSEVDRIAIALLLESGINDDHAGEFERFYLIKGLIEKNINCPRTSSLGRLFDGVAAILDITGSEGRAHYESQVAQLLQREAEKSVHTSFRFAASAELDFRPMIRNLIKAKRENVPISEIAYAFHLWVVASFLEFVDNHQQTQDAVLVLSGGCMQNKLLANLFCQQLRERQREFYINQLIPTNDAGISIGQLMII